MQPHTAKSRSRPFTLRAATAACAAISGTTAFVAAPTASASLLVHEPFSGYSNGATLNTVTPNANATGLDTTTAYGGTANQYIVNNTALAFTSALQQTGGHVTFGTAPAVAAGQLDLAVAKTGTLWHSYLIKMNGKGSATGDGTHTRVADSTSTSNTRYQAYADSRSGANVLNAAIAYSGSATNGSAELANGEVYAVISRFTNVGATSGSGVGTLFALNSDQYDSFVAAGGTEAYLDSTTIGTAPNEITARVSTPGTSLTSTNLFTDGNYIHMVSVAAGGAFDELRYGDTLLDVTPTPEPGSAVAGLVLAATSLRRRRCRRPGERVAV